MPGGCTQLDLDLGGRRLQGTCLCHAVLLPIDLATNEHVILGPVWQTDVAACLLARQAREDCDCVCRNAHQMRGSNADKTAVHSWPGAHVYQHLCSEALCAAQQCCESKSRQAVSDICNLDET